MDIKKNLLFFIDKSGNDKDGKIRLRIRYKSGVINFNVGYRAEFSKWNKEAQRCKAGTTHGKKKVSATEINKEIQRLEDLAINVFKSFEVVEHLPTIQEYRNAFNKENGKENGMEIKKIDLFHVYDEFTKEIGYKNNWTVTTFKKFSSVKKHLKDFNDKLSFDNLDEAGLNDYLAFLRDTEKMRNSTIENQIDFVKMFLRWANLKGIHNNTDFTVFNPKMKSTPKKVIFLTWDELMNLRAYKVPETKQYIDRVKDVFLFSCFTSLRYSDVYNLKRADIKNGFIEVVTVKTADALTIDLNDYAKEILEKYDDFHFENDKALPVISNQKMNTYLKELCELAGINEPIRITYYKGNERIDEVHPKYALMGTHAGRRTFICNSLAMGIPAQTVMRWTGHSDYKAMKPYIDIADSEKSKAMEKWNKKDDDLIEKLKQLPKEDIEAILKAIGGEKQ